MTKQLFHRKSLKQQQEEAINSLPTSDNKAVEGAKIYLGMSDESLSKLPEFHPDGTPYLYNVGEALMGKMTLIQFVKSIKNK